VPSAVLDTNVIVSAVISERGAPRRILEAWRNERFTVVTAPILIAEVGRALRYDRVRVRYGVTDEDIRATVALLWTQSALVDDPTAVVSLTGDPDDDVLVACARAGEVDFLVSGDNRVRALGTVDKTRVVSPAQFLSEIGLGPAS